MTKDDLPPAIYGAWDGSISILGVLVASSHLGARQLLVAGLGGSIAATFSMATGQYVELPGAARKTNGVRLAVVMGIFTLLGGLLFVLPFLAGKTVGFVLGTTLTVVLATVVWILRYRADSTDPTLHESAVASAVMTYALLAVTAVATIAVSVTLA